MSSTLVEPVVIVLQLCLALCDPMDCGTPDFPLSPSPGLCSNSCPLRKWCHPTISYSVVPFSSCPQSFPASGSFPMCQLFESCVQNTGTSESIFPMNIQDWFPLALTSLILQSKDSQESSPAPQFESISSSALSQLYGPTLTSIHDCWKNHSFDYTDLCQQSDITAFYEPVLQGFGCWLLARFHSVLLSNPSPPY